MELLCRFDPGHHALMLVVAGHAVEAVTLHGNDAHALFFGQLQQVARTRVLPLPVQIDFGDAFRALPNAADYGVEAVN